MNNLTSSKPMLNHSYTDLCISNILKENDEKIIQFQYKKASKFLCPIDGCLYTFDTSQKVSHHIVLTHACEVAKTNFTSSITNKQSTDMFRNDFGHTAVNSFSVLPLDVTVVELQLYVNMKPDIQICGHCAKSGKLFFKFAGVHRRRQVACAPLFDDVFGPRHTMIN